MNLVMSLASMPPPVQDSKMDEPKASTNQEALVTGAALDIDLEKISKDHESEMKRL